MIWHVISLKYSSLTDFDSKKLNLFAQWNILEVVELQKQCLKRSKMGFLKPAAGGFFLKIGFFMIVPPPCFRRFGNKGGHNQRNTPDSCFKNYQTGSRAPLESFGVSYDNRIKWTIYAGKSSSWSHAFGRYHSVSLFRWLCWKSIVYEIIIVLCWTGQ